MRLPYRMGRDCPNEESCVSNDHRVGFGFASATRSKASATRRVTRLPLKVRPAQVALRRPLVFKRPD